MTVEYAPRGLIGVLTPQANTTVEPEFSILWPAGVAMINARLMSPKATLNERLLDYFDQLDSAAAQFHNAPVDTVVLACTGASYLAGLEREQAATDRLAARLGVPFITAGQASAQALRTLGARRIGLVSPYPADLTEISVRYWEACGFTVAAVAAVTGDGASFHPIYSIAAAGTREGLQSLAAERLDAILMLGTGMPTLEPILDCPEVGGAPVMSCMLCLGWAAVTALDPGPPTADSLLAWTRGRDWGRRLAARRWPQPADA
jgi:maleate cis-trans isomerase